MPDDTPTPRGPQPSAALTESTFIRMTTMQSNIISAWADEHGTSFAAALRFFLNRGIGLNARGTEFDKDAQTRYAEYVASGNPKKHPEDEE